MRKSSRLLASGKDLTNISTGGKTRGLRTRGGMNYRGRGSGNRGALAGSRDPPPKSKLSNFLDGMF